MVQSKGQRDSLPQDENGFAVPAADLLCDQLCECELLDPEWADPADWRPAWDAWRFEPGAPSTPEESIPDPTDQDLEDAYRASRYQDHLEGIARFTDEDLAATGQCPG